MKDKVLYIVDIRFKQINLNLLDYISYDNSHFLSLTPYSSYILSRCSLEYSSYDSIISEENFRDNILSFYNKTEFFFKEHKEFIFLMRNIAFIQTYEHYLNNIFNFLNKKKLENYKIIYITDVVNEQDVITSLNNFKNRRYNYDFDQTIFIDKKDYLFYMKNKFTRMITILGKKGILKKIINKYKMNLSYDNKNFENLYSDLKPIHIKNKIDKNNLYGLIETIKSHLLNATQISDMHKLYSLMFDNIRNLASESEQDIKVKPFTFLSQYEDYKHILLYKENHIPKIFMQHGSYLQENIFLKYCEIYPADINFVFNDYTKELFEEKGSNSVYTVGSMNFNYNIQYKNIKYDFLYIIHCSNYGYSGTYIGSETNLISSDASNIYQRHKEVIELFGSKLKDKKICVKIQPGIFLGDMLYIPFIELCDKYTNITIEFSSPISSLIEESKYLISDYFSSEFINRDIHYKKDIILFYGSPIFLPENILDDMKKMFILVETVNDLEEKINDIEYIVKERKRYSSIIEKYSSKNCDTKLIVTNIIKSALNGR